jgi:hypothetical protein
MAAFKSSGNLIQHLAVDRAQAVFFGEIFDLDDGRHFFKGIGNSEMGNAKWGEVAEYMKKLKC